MGNHGTPGFQPALDAPRIDAAWVPAPRNESWDRLWQRVLGVVIEQLSQDGPRGDHAEPASHVHPDGELIPNVR